MKVLQPGSAIIIRNPSALPVFLGPVPPRIRMFDIYYTEVPMVGFHVLGASDLDPQVVGFQVAGFPDNEVDQ